jgi:hypothetical protein
VRALAFLLVLLAAPVGAHEPSSPLRVTLVVASERTTLHVGLRYTGAAARELAEQLDRDVSGELDAEERARLAELLAGKVAAALALVVDGQARVLSAQKPRVELGGGEVILELELRGAAIVGEVVLAVEWPDARAITPVVVRGVPGTTRGEASRGAPLRFRVSAPAR